MTKQRWGGKQPCQRCKGTGIEPGREPTPVSCGRCGGSGWDPT